MVLVRGKLLPAPTFPLDGFPCAGPGGVIRNHEGTWVTGFLQNLGYGTNNDAELWGIQSDLELAANLEIKSLEVETDSIFVVNALQDCSVKCLNQETLIAFADC
ncbi:hypothetical protein SLA2020_202010 [Shorea laevis]